MLVHTKSAGRRRDQNTSQSQQQEICMSLDYWIFTEPFMDLCSPYPSHFYCIIPCTHRITLLLGELLLKTSKWTRSHLVIEGALDPIIFKSTVDWHMKCKLFTYSYVVPSWPLEAGGVPQGQGGLACYPRAKHMAKYGGTEWTMSISQFSSF